MFVQHVIEIFAVEDDIFDDRQREKQRLDRRVSFFC